MKTSRTIAVTVAAVSAVVATSITIGLAARPRTAVASVSVGGAAARVTSRATSTVVEPNGLAVDGNGDVYVADVANHVVDEITSAGVISVVAGIPGPGGAAAAGPAASSKLSNPNGLAMDGSGNLYIADSGSDQVIEEVGGAPAQLSFAAGVLGQSGPLTPGPASGSQLDGPSGLAVDGSGDIYVADSLNGVVEEISDGIVSVVAGTPGTFGAPVPGPATASGLYDPSGVAVYGGDLYIADSGNHVVEKVDSSGTLSIVAGVLTDDGYGEKGQPTSGAPATDSDLGDPTGLAFDSAGDLYIADPSNDVVEEVDTSGTLSVVAGIPGTAGRPTKGPATNSALDAPSEVAVAGNGTLYIADTGNDRVDKVVGGVLSLFAGTGRTTSLTAIQEKATAAINARVRSTQSLMQAVGTAQWLTVTDQTRALAILQPDLTRLLRLSTTIGADTTTSQATADYRSVFYSFRIYALALQQVDLAAASDDLLYGVVPQLTDAYSGLQALLTGPDQGQDTPALDAALADLQTQISAISQETAGLAATLLSYTPAQFNREPSLLTGPKAVIAAATAASTTAGQDIETIEEALGVTSQSQPASLQAHRSAAAAATKIASDDLRVAAAEQSQAEQPQ